MNRFTRTWIRGDEIETADKHIPVRQVYVWIVTTDKQVIIVSKDGVVWQLPGGKPEDGESLIETAKREAKEETGTDITSYTDILEFFGYYMINEPASDPANYLQVRYILNLPIASSALALNIDHEDTRQKKEDAIRFVETISASEVARYMPWMPTTEEYRYLVNTHVISQ